MNTRIITVYTELKKRLYLSSLLLMMSVFLFSFQNSSVNYPTSDITVTSVQPASGKNNGSIHIVIKSSEATVLFFSEQDPLPKQFKNQNDILIANLSAGKYEIVVHLKNNNPYMEAVILSNQQ